MTIRGGQFVRFRARRSRQNPPERIRRVFIPGIAAALGLLYWTGTGATRGGASWILRLPIPFTHVPLLTHWGLIVSFTVAGAISALYGALVNSSPKQRYIAALFPVDSYARL